MKDRRPCGAVSSPSDALSADASGRVRIGGRLHSVEGAECIVADAFQGRRVRLRAPVPCVVGDLVILEGIPEGVDVVDGQLLWQQPGGPVCAEDGEYHRLVQRGVGRNLRARSEALQCIRRFFLGRGFIDADTPVRVPVPGLDAHVHAIPAQGGFLITSPEHQMKRLLVGGVPRVFQLVHCSRAEERGPLHEPEFLMLEWYRAFAGMSEVLADTEEIVREVVQTLSADDSLRHGHGVHASPPFEQLTVRQAFREFAGVPDAVALAKDDEDQYFQVFVDAVEPGLARRSHPVFLKEFPVSQGGLARRTAHDPSVVERFELFIGGVELCNGYGELTDPAEQVQRFEVERARRARSSEPVYPLDQRFLDSLAEGCPPAGGNALGVDRLIAVALGMQQIADVIPFPASRL